MSVLFAVADCRAYSSGLKGFRLASRRANELRESALLKHIYLERNDRYTRLDAVIGTEPERSTPVQGFRIERRRSIEDPDELPHLALISRFRKLRHLMLYGFRLDHKQTVSNLSNQLAMFSFLELGDCFLRPDCHGSQLYHQSNIELLLPTPKLQHLVLEHPDLTELRAPKIAHHTLGVRAFTRKAQYYGNSWYSSIKVL
jgi:hypothetical protein